MKPFIFSVLFFMFSMMTQAQTESWKMKFHLNDSVDAVFDVLIEHGENTLGMTIENGGESIYLNSIEGQEFPGFLFPYFDTKIEWRPADKGDMAWKGWFIKKGGKPVNFDAQRQPYNSLDDATQSGKSLKQDMVIEKRQKVVFEPGTPDVYNAIGLFDLYPNGICTGTFLTETGDYRFLKGEWDGDHIQMQCLDGAHLFCFTAEIAHEYGSFINGRFYSGNTYSEKWEGEDDLTFELRNPEELVHLKKSSEGEVLTFSAMDLQGEMKTFGAADWKGHLSIIQLMGTWCPNCTDEGKVMAAMHKKYGAKGLQIIPVAFERSDDIAENKRVIQKQMAQLNCGYEAYVGRAEGKGKERAQNVFPQLEKVMAFPTMIVVNSEGKVIHIHTGFNGPATGKYHTKEVLHLEKMIEDGLKAIH
ncbi:MAG: TlpA family protein disulfide reductase [Bacteroidetes bacterium]|nr:TlpA family protein disulfide reductase [Bacteroidota bacterium]